MPQEGRFFELFNAHAQQVVDGGQALVSLMASLVDSPREALAHAQAIDLFESKADKITSDTLALIHTSFITPFDRDEIHKLTNGLDDILDTIQDVAESLTLYDIRRVTPEARQLADLCLSCCLRVRTVVGLLDSMNNATGIMKTCAEIHQLESDADRVLRTAMSRLFRDEADVRQVIKLKVAYELLEAVTDRCETVAGIIEAIVLENA
ncbi:DUF47 domain-containing protein [Azovibrio restrictus]|uniref:DUF47 domain-containing protein n=1 Tax=Azovibrio restrictus TaxID=146938 RepID=UPI0026F274B5|nr:DUF47 family protein [Azovibrio restrictus]